MSPVTTCLSSRVPANRHRTASYLMTARGDRFDAWTPDEEGTGNRASMAVTDEELVARVVAGDTDSFNQLILRWERPIYALAFRQLGREEDARDVSQEAFLRAFRALPGFKGQAKFSSWLYRITLNLCRDWMRRQRRAPFVPTPEGVDIGDLVTSETTTTASVEDLLARKDLGRHVARAMLRLPDEQRSAILLKEYHGLTFQEIADLQGCPLSTVKTRLYQGLSVLRRDLTQQGTMKIEAASDMP
jgi:RNA polymerase sigma-70 factor (ECF subfamily)